MGNESSSFKKVFELLDKGKDMILIVIIVILQEIAREIIERTNGSLFLAPPSSSTLGGSARDPQDSVGSILSTRISLILLRHPSSSPSRFYYNRFLNILKTTMGY